LIDLITTTQLLLGSSSGATGAEGLVSFMPLIIIFVIFYFLLIRPQQKKQQDHKRMIDNLKRGNKIITTGGIYGTIEGITDTSFQLKIANQVKVTVSRSAVAGLQPGETAATEDKDKDK
jgi:preprotein translocase subunit YajC